MILNPQVEKDSVRETKDPSCFRCMARSSIMPNPPEVISEQKPSNPDGNAVPGPLPNTCQAHGLQRASCYQSPRRVMYARFCGSVTPVAEQ